MSEIPVWTLIPSSGAVPSDLYDPVSQAGYREWELNDEARFGIVVPDTYRSGSDFFLRWHESSSSVSANHRWQVIALLLRPEVDATDEQDEVETSAFEFESAAATDQLSTRICCVTGSAQAGHIGDAAIAPGDLLSFTIKRIPASENEDPHAIKVLALSLMMAVLETTVSECAGRVGGIVDTVRDLFNESLGGFLSDDFILRSINRCQQDLAQEGYWRRESWIPASSGQNHVDLLTLLPDYQDVHQARFSGLDHAMKPLPGFQEYQELKTGSNVPGLPEYYIVQNDRMYVWPPPNVDLQSGYCLYHSYLPDELTCSSANPNPPLPKTHDMVFVYFTLKQAFLRDRHAPGADTKFNEYSRLYEQEKQNLLGEADPPGMSLRCYR
ncbi:MAG: hypothetical protein P8182_11940 [Deltaproteobacteria bacterium]